MAPFISLEKKTRQKITISGNLYCYISSIHGNLFGAPQLGKISMCCSRTRMEGRLGSAPCLLINLKWF